jgi:hypothetical protein
MIMSGIMTDSRVEILAVSEFLNWKIEYLEVDEDFKIIEKLMFSGANDTPEKTILLVYHKGKHFVEV